MGGKKIVKISLIILAVTIALFLFFEFAVLRTTLWYKLPAYWKTQVAFIKLEELAMDKSCREMCVLYRGSLDNIISGYMAKNPGVFDEQIERYIKDDKADSDFKFFLLGIVMSSERNKKEVDSNYEIKIPEYLIEYLKDKNNNPNIRAQILSTFSNQLGSLPWLIADLVEIIKDKNKSIDQRIPAIIDLWKLIVESEESGEEYRENKGFLTPKYKSIDYPELAEMFLSLVEDEEEDEQLRYEALDSLYSILNFKNVYEEEIFSRVLKIFKDKRSHLGIKYKALLLLKLYNKKDLEKATEVMNEIYNDKTEHKYLTYNAWAFFGRPDENKYREPEIDENVYREYSSEASDLHYTKY